MFITLSRQQDKKNATQNAASFGINSDDFIPTWLTLIQPELLSFHERLI